MQEQVCYLFPTFGSSCPVGIPIFGTNLNLQKETLENVMSNNNTSLIKGEIISKFEKEIFHQKDKTYYRCFLINAEIESGKEHIWICVNEKCPDYDKCLNELSMSPV